MIIEDDGKILGPGLNQGKLGDISATLGIPVCGDQPCYTSPLPADRRPCKITWPGERASAIPGNIGIVKGKVIIWDHDPFLARPHQVIGFPFSGMMSQALPDNSPDVNFEIEAAYLKPIFTMHDMFIATINPRLASKYSNPNPDNPNIVVSSKLDFVGSVASNVGQVASTRLPGGLEYELNGGFVIKIPGLIPIIIGPEVWREVFPHARTGMDIFPHQLWLHVGSIFKGRPDIHPSEYSKNPDEIGSISNHGDTPQGDPVPVDNTASNGEKSQTTTVPSSNSKIVTLDDILVSAKWDYVPVNESGVQIFTPTLLNKKPPASKATSKNVHWTLEKFSPVWQGTDFFVTIMKGTRDVDPTVDNFSDLSSVRSEWKNYRYLMYTNPSGYTPNPQDPWVDGISNAAFYVAPASVVSGTAGNIVGTIQSSMDAALIAQKARDAARTRYWWNDKAYILIEIGYDHPHHNYFIELVKGRNPRFLHLGREWDNPNRLKTENLNPQDFIYMTKCRQLSQYDTVSCDSLFSRERLRVSVRNHLGRMVVTFEGHEGNPWIITRMDHVPHRTDFSKRLVPMVVPASRLRIHGGNMSVNINYSPTSYVNNESIPFANRQADTHEATNSDVYMTFSNQQGSRFYESKSMKREYFSDPRFSGDAVSYDDDAKFVTEIHKNSIVNINLYEEVPEQYQKFGKGWVTEFKRDDRGNIIIDDDTKLPIESGLVDKMFIPSELRIFNVKNPTADRDVFKFGIEDISRNYEYAEYVSKWDVGVQLRAGSVKLPNPQCAIPQPYGEQTLIIRVDERAGDKLFLNCVTPIASSWRMIVLGGSKPVQGKVIPFDVAPIVTKLTDGWTADGFTTINHEAQVTCYIPYGVPQIGREIKDSTKSPVSIDGSLGGSGGDTIFGDITFEDSGINSPDTIPGLDGTPAANIITSNTHTLGQKMLSLRDKAFYVTIAYWWDNGIGERDAIENTLSDTIYATSIPEQDPLLIQMTGIAYGGEIEISNNKRYMNFTVKDYMSVFQKQFIFNSPFFDGVSDVTTCLELGKMAGFDDLPPTGNLGAITPIDRSPLGYLKHVQKNADAIKEGVFIYNGEESRCRAYDLPGSYATLVNPAVKFQNGETYENAYKKIAQLASKIVYFDRWGVLRLENIPAIEAAFASYSGTEEEGDDGELKFKSVFNFYSSPIPLKDPIELSSLGGGTAFPIPSFDSNLHASHLVYEVIKTSRSVEDCVNQIVLLTASNDIVLSDGTSVGGGLIVEGYTFFDQLWDPTVEGFLGFRKPFYQSNGVFGGLEGVRHGLQHYAKMQYPPAKVSFETYGVPGLKALDIVTLDGNYFYITEISHDIDPQTNRWWMTIQGEWLKPFLDDLGVIKERAVTSQE